MKTLITLLALNILLSASLLDFSYLDDAKEAYEKKEYTKAEKLYQKVEGDEARFNEADTLYKQKKYQEALDLYHSIESEQLAFEKQHNIGNCYAQLQKIDEGIEAYKEALKLKKDADTQFNLELLKKKKEQQQKKENKQDKKDDKNKKSKDKQEKNKEQKENNKKSENEKKKEEQQQKKKDKKDKKKKKEDEKKQDAQKAKENKPQPPISDMEERKYQKMLNQKGINTLMLPLNDKGEENDNINPW
jgi:Ca-activated chloride channel family protein